MKLAICGVTDNYIIIIIIIIINMCTYAIITFMPAGDILMSSNLHHFK